MSNSIGETLGLAEWIIDDSWSNKISNVGVASGKSQENLLFKNSPLEMLICKVKTYLRTKCNLFQLKCTLLVYQNDPP